MRYEAITPGGYAIPLGKAKDKQDAIRLFLLRYDKSMRKPWDEMERIGWKVEATT
jgi:hypothetical protein